MKNKKVDHIGSDIGIKTTGANIVSDSLSNIYQLDPDFKPYPAPEPLSGPGLQLAPQEREIVRRLVWRSGITHSTCIPSSSADNYKEFLPKGVTLTDGQIKLLSELANDDGRGLEALTQLDYRVQPPSIEQFIEDDFFLGASLRRTANNEGLWPWWQDWSIKHANRESFVHNLVLGGAIGLGKTLMMVTLLLYRVCLCASLRNPYLFYGLSRGSPIHVVLLSLSVETLRSTAWLRALGLMEQSPFFRKLCCSSLETAPTGMEVILRTSTDGGDSFQIILSGGSKSQHQIGRNVLCVGLDEGNFRLEKDPQEYAYELFNDLRTRIASRFRRIGAFTPGLSIIASAAAGESCFTEELIRQIEKDRDPEGQIVVSPALYRVKPGVRHSSWWFRVSFGLPNIEPRLLKGCYTMDGKAILPPNDCPAEIAGPHEPVPQGARTELVPGDYYDEYAHATRKNLQQISGISLGGSNRLFPSLVDVYKCLGLSAKEGVPTPTAATIISVSDENGRPIRDDLDHKAFIRRLGNRYEPIRHPNRGRYVHLDLAITGRAGLAICHLVDQCPPQPTTETWDAGAHLVVEYDFILTLSPGKAGEICYEKIFEFLCWLRDICGYHISLVTTDSCQSVHMRQRLNFKGIKADLQSVDRDKGAYLAWQAGFQGGHIRLYSQAQLLEEMLDLIELESKIEVPHNRRKDTCDAAAAAYLSAITSAEVGQLAVPVATPVVLGPSPHCNATPADPFGFLSRLPPRTVKVFDA